MNEIPQLPERSDIEKKFNRSEFNSPHFLHLLENIFGNENIEINLDVSYFGNNIDSLYIWNCTGDVCNISIVFHDNTFDYDKIDARYRQDDDELNFGDYYEVKYSMEWSLYNVDGKNIPDMSQVSRDIYLYLEELSQKTKLLDIQPGLMAALISTRSQDQASRNQALESVKNIQETISNAAMVCLNNTFQYSPPSQTVKKNASDELSGFYMSELNSSHMIEYMKDLFVDGDQRIHLHPDGFGENVRSVSIVSHDGSHCILDIQFYEDTNEYNNIENVYGKSVSDNKGHQTYSMNYYIPWGIHENGHIDINNIPEILFNIHQYLHFLSESTSLLQISLDKVASHISSNDQGDDQIRINLDKALDWKMIDQNKI